MENRKVLKIKHSRSSMGGDICSKCRKYAHTLIDGKCLQCQPETFWDPEWKDYARPLNTQGATHAGE